MTTASHATPGPCQARTFSWACRPQTGATPAISSPLMLPFQLFGFNCPLQGFRVKGVLHTGKDGTPSQDLLIYPGRV